MNTFLNKIGKQIHKASEVKVGDIVGKGNIIYNYEEIRLYYADKVDLNPCFLKWIGPMCPCVDFKAPHIGFSVKDDKVGRTHIHTPMPGTERSCYKWSEMTLEEAIKEGWDKEKEFGFDIKDECFDLYLITDESYITLGNLIPCVEVPYWGVMCQTLNGPAPLIEFVNNTKEYFKKANEMYNKINEEADRISR